MARHDGRVVFVRHALPGERVVAQVTDGDPTSRFLRADAVEVLEASPDRVEPPCPYAGPGRCGGCDWQHASLPAQRLLKAQVVAEQLHRLAGIDRAVEVEAVPGDVAGLRWRTRVHFAVDDQGRAGLRRHRSHEVVAVDDCVIASPGVCDAGVMGRTWPGVDGIDVVDSSTGDRAVLTRDAAGRSRRVLGGTHVTESAAGRRFRVDVAGFWQVHPGAADALVGAVLAGLAPVPGESALDLYCGVGLFAGALAEVLGPSGAVTAVELDRRAVGHARRNLRDLPQVRLVGAPVERALRPGGTVAAAVDLVVLDPPRSGAGRRVVTSVVGRAPRAVAYVACDPAALARDLATFAEHGYRLTTLRAFDIFPMTAHVECLAVLVPTTGTAAHPPEPLVS